MLGITKVTVQVAAAKAHEDGGRTRMVALALQGIEYFVDLIHRHETSGLGTRDNETRNLASRSPPSFIQSFVARRL